MRSSPTMNHRSSLDLIEVKPGLKFSLAVLKDFLPDIETALFFGKVYKLDYLQLSNLLHHVLHSDVANALFSGDHSTELQGYLVGEYDEFGDWCPGVVPPAQQGDLAFSKEVPKGEILPELWKQLEVDIANSIKEVAAKLESVIGLMPGKQGRMVFNTMMKMNKHRPTLGVHQAQVQHDPVKENLLILDVSGSMTSSTIEKIIDDVVAMSYMANAHLAIVSNTTTHWEPGSYDVESVLRACQFAGTHYETLASLLDKDWGVVVTVADYDSSHGAKEHIRRSCHGSIDQVLDISLVNRPTFLAECVGQLAQEVRPLLIAQSSYVIRD